MGPKNPSLSNFLQEKLTAMKNDTAGIRRALNRRKNNNFSRKAMM